VCRNAPADPGAGFIQSSRNFSLAPAEKTSTPTVAPLVAASGRSAGRRPAAFGSFLARGKMIMSQPTLFAQVPLAAGTLGAASTQPALKVDQVKAQWDAFQSLRRDLESMIDRLGDDMASANQIQETFGITPTTVRRLAASSQVHRTGRRRKRYHVRDVLLAVLRSGTGRIRRPRTAVGYGQPGTQPGCGPVCSPTSPKKSAVAKPGCRKCKRNHDLWRFSVAQMLRFQVNDLLYL
jgi:hypothetical protein